MSTNLKPQEVATWMREQARRFTEMAEQIESTFSLNGRPVVPTQRVDSAESVTESVRDLLRDGKARRLSTISDELQIGIVGLDEILEDSAVFARNERGWISLVGGENA